MSVEAERATTAAASATLYVEFWRYLVVSVVALGADYAFLIGLTEIADLHYLVSGAAGFLVGAAVAYLGSVRWVFSVRRLSNPGHELTLFTLIGVVGLGINELMLWALTEGFGLHYAVSKLGAAGMGFVFNFVVRKYALFR